MTTTTCPMTTETKRLFGWVRDWDEARTPVLALLFGELVKRAAPIVQEYQSDLFHDAAWLQGHVNGPTEFYWMARHSGTNMDGAAVIWEQITTTEPRELYHVALTVDGGAWYVTFTLLVKVTAD